MHADIGAIASALNEAGLLVEQRGSTNVVITDVTDDSRVVTDGALFIAVKGTERAGHDYLAAAPESGAVAAIVEDASRTDLPALVVNDGRRAAAIAAAAFFDWPSPVFSSWASPERTVRRPRSTCSGICWTATRLAARRSARSVLRSAARLRHSPVAAGLQPPARSSSNASFVRCSTPACVASRWRSRLIRSTSGAWKACRSAWAGSRS